MDIAPMKSKARERDCVRELARKVAELAASPEAEACRKRWRDVNGLRKPDRSPVYCRPVGCWPELLPEDSLVCSDKFYRGVERALRMLLVKHEIGDDTIFNPWWEVAAAIELEGEHTWGVPINRVSSNVPGGAWKYDPPIKDDSDLDRLRMPAFVHNEQKSRRRLEMHEELLGDILPVRLVCGFPLGATLCTDAADLMGLDAMMLNMAMKPAVVHRLMRFLQQGVLHAMDQVERMGILTENNTAEMYCSDSLRRSPAGAPLTAGDLWASANSQEFQEVSPAMWKEFLLDYQRPILERFALVSYGCCENLTRKIDGVLSLRNLRIFVSSAWTDLAKVVEAVGNRYTIMWRQKATDVVFAQDLAPIRKHLEEGMKLSRGCYRQIVLRELQTLNGHPERLREWATVAKEIAQKYN
jgi:hypothetical protein